MEPWLRGLYDAEGMRATDSWAIADQGVSSLELMETAGRAVAEVTVQREPLDTDAMAGGGGEHRRLVLPGRQVDEHMQAADRGPGVPVR